MPDDGAGAAALALLDQALAKKPGKDDQVLSQATVCLGQFRDRLAAALRGAEPDAGRSRQLAHVNAVITVVLGVHYPLGEVPWDELAGARGWLAQAVAEDAG